MFNTKIKMHRDQRDFLTLVRCMLCLIPQRAVSFRDDLENMVEELSYPESGNLIDLNKKLALILYNYYDIYKALPWMESVMAIYLNKNVSSISSRKAYLNKSKDINIEDIKSLCEDGIFEVSLDIFENEQIAYITLKDTQTNQTVTLKKLP